MSERKSAFLFCGFVLSACLITAATTAFLMTNASCRTQFQLINTLCNNIIEKQPETGQIVFTALKDSINSAGSSSDTDTLLSYGYRPSDFLTAAQRYSPAFAGIGFLSGICILLGSFYMRHRKECLRIKALTSYLEHINTKNFGVLLPTKEDEFSKLQDEIYKTVTMLHQTRDEALKAKNNYAKNLSNISHQLKTPITAISLSTQMLGEKTSEEYVTQILRQLSRLTHLEESLLLLSRIDAGTLPLEKVSVDVFTLLTLAGDNLQEIMTESDVFLDIPELGEMQIMVDPDWTMEAVMNIVKNCMEHTPSGGTIHCTYSENPLYTQMLIQDEGPGFAKEDIPHLFERFYRGKNTRSEGIGIGLSLSKEIIEKQNGTIRAYNIPEKGACFEIRFYCH